MFYWCVWRVKIDQDGGPKCRRDRDRCCVVAVICSLHRYLSLSLCLSLCLRQISPSTLVTYPQFTTITWPTWCTAVSFSAVSTWRSSVGSSFDLDIWPFNFCSLSLCWLTHQLWSSPGCPTVHVSMHLRCVDVLTFATVLDNWYFMSIVTSSRLRMAWPCAPFYQYTEHFVPEFSGAYLGFQITRRNCRFVLPFPVPLLCTSLLLPFLLPLVVLPIFPPSLSFRLYSLSILLSVHHLQRPSQSSKLSQRVWVEPGWHTFLVHFDTNVHGGRMPVPFPVNELFVLWDLITLTCDILTLNINNACKCSNRRPSWWALAFLAAHHLYNSVCYCTLPIVSVLKWKQNMTMMKATASLLLDLNIVGLYVIFVVDILPPRHIYRRIKISLCCEPDFERWWITNQRATNWLANWLDWQSVLIVIDSRVIVIEVHNWTAHLFTYLTHRPNAEC